MRVILGLALDACLHREIAHDVLSGGADHGIEERPGNILGQVFREELAIHLDPKPRINRLQGNGLGGQGYGQQGKDGEDSGEAHEGVMLSR